MAKPFGNGSDFLITWLLWQNFLETETILTCLLWENLFSFIQQHTSSIAAYIRQHSSSIVGGDNIYFTIFPGKFIYVGIWRIYLGNSNKFKHSYMLKRSLTYKSVKNLIFYIKINKKVIVGLKSPIIIQTGMTEG
jgi:hypothetical protein